MADSAGFAAAITVREHVLRTALTATYANGSNASKTFTADLSDGSIGMVPDFFLGQPRIDCQGTTNLLVATLPMWGRLTITLDQGATAVDLFGEAELTITPTFKKGLAGTDTESSLVLDPLVTVINARRWTATVTSLGTPANIVALATGEEFRSRFEAKFRQGFLFGQVSLPSIDASFLGPMAKKSTSAGARVRNGALLIGLGYTDETHSLTGDPEGL